MAAVMSVASLEAAFYLTLDADAVKGKVEAEGAADAGEGAVKVKRQVRVHKLQVSHAAAARELFRDMDSWYVTNDLQLRKLERADAILSVIELALLPALLENPSSPEILHSLARRQKKLRECVDVVGGSFVAVGYKLAKRMKKVGTLCRGHNDHTTAELRAALEDLGNRVAAVRGTDVQLDDALVGGSR